MVKVRVREYRIKKGLSQMELARKLNVSQQAVSAWESGERCPSVATAKKLSEVLGVKWTKFYE